jgi:hypothetical protein
MVARKRLNVTFPHIACLVLSTSKVGLSATFQCTPTNTDASADEDLKKNANSRG